MTHRHLQDIIMEVMMLITISMGCQIRQIMN